VKQESGHVIFDYGLSNGKNSFISPWMETGSYGRMDYGVDGGIVWKNVSIGLFYDHKELDNYYLYNDRGLNTRNRDYNHNRFHGKATGTIGENTTFSLSGGDMKATTGYGISNNLKLENYQDASQPYVNFQITSKFMSNLEIKGQLDWIHAGHDYYGETLENVTWRPLPSGQRIPVFDYKPSVNITDADRYRANLYTNYILAENHLITVGTEVVYTEAEKGIYELPSGRILNVQGRPGVKADVDETDYSFYAQYDWTFLKNFELIVGGRFDHFETYGSEFSPKATLRWNYWQDGNLKISAGKGFRAPNLNELYSPPWTISPFIVYQGNPDLKAETTWSYEVSAEQYFWDKKIYARVTPYYTKGEDFINAVRHPDPLNPGGQIMQPENIEEVKIKGVDVELAYYIKPKIKLFLNYNYNETRDDKTDEILEGYPKNSLAMGIRAVQPLVGDLKLFASYSARYRGEYKSTSWGNPPVTERVGDYWYHTAGLTLDWKNLIQLSLDLYNIFNEREKKDISNYIPERNYIIGASIKYAF
jgi:outer membrane receptor for ferrienterochelin and colicin